MVLPILRCFTNDNENWGIKEKYTQEELQNLKDDVIIRFVGADCWGCKLNEEILWDSYEYYDKYNKVEGNCIKREEILNNPEIFIQNIIKNKNDNKIIIYMFGSNHWGVIINYKNEEKTFYVSIGYDSENTRNYILTE